ncbi:transmembrane protein 218-like [Xenia sp. Carnegie-2017]|uniref:transmembrane protein 218-like n=1 Tax=Xenia sp. Carnegie-2017 TaxID=2897299 RepID=UPI001F035390|nr:transmembrane protein 218-like [Xenia sp. Carnegie-2017]
MSLILGIGSGLFAVILIWIIGLVLAIAFSRVSNLRNGVPGIALLITIITVVFIFYPRESKDDAETSSKQPVDNIFVLRITVFVVASLFVFISLVLMLLFHWMEPQYASPVRTRMTEKF